MLIIVTIKIFFYIPASTLQSETTATSLSTVTPTSSVLQTTSAWQHLLATTSRKSDSHGTLNVTGVESSSITTLSDPTADNVVITEVVTLLQYESVGTTEAITEGVTGQESTSMVSMEISPYHAGLTGKFPC